MHRKTLKPIIIFLGLVLIAATAPAQEMPDCAWSDAFYSNGPSREVFTATVFDDGFGGRDLYVGGGFQTLGPERVQGIARWDGSAWSAVGDGIDGSVFALEVFNDGSGPKLYTGGVFSSAGASPASTLASWDGVEWTPLPSEPSGFVYALAVFDDGSGPALYAAGSFNTVGGLLAESIAKWDGQQWTTVGDGFLGTVLDLQVFDDGSGPALYAAGFLIESGAEPIHGVARWTGTEWVNLGTGLSEAARSLTVFDDGSGPALVAGGLFETAGGQPAAYVASWDGTAWSALGQGFDRQVYGLRSFDDGTGASLYATGLFATADGQPVGHVARWDGTAWSPMSSGLEGVRGNGFAIYAPEKQEEKLHVLGHFGSAGGAPASHIARWSSSEWQRLGPASFTGQGVNDSTEALESFAGDLYAGGFFASAGDAEARHIARWDGAAWHPLGTGTDDIVRALKALDLGDGMALYAGGNFEQAGSVAASHIAKWDGSVWTNLDLGTNSLVFAIIGFDDGDGFALYAAGSFTQAGGVSAARIAKWDGTSWSPLGSGLDGTVYVLEVFDDGEGPALYAGGDFTTAGGMTAEGIAKWDGTSWAALADGLASDFGQPRLRALTVHDDGSGPALYAGGSFTEAGGLPAPGIARWTDRGWQSVGTASLLGTDDLVTFDNGLEKGLAAVNRFGLFGVYFWDGAAWTLLPDTFDQDVHVGLSLDHGDETSLFLGGLFTQIGTVPSSFIGEYRCQKVALFADGFESGDTASWTTVVGGATSP